MNYIYGLIELPNALIAPIRVISDKIYDYTFINSTIENEKEMERLYQKNILLDTITPFITPTEVYPRIYLGSAVKAASYYTMKSLGIKYIINVSVEMSNYYPDYFTYYQIPIRDNNNESIKKYLNESYNKINEFLDKNDGNIFVHCHMGASRSVTIVTNFICKKTDRNMYEVFNEIKQMRPNINPTIMFVNDLKQELEDDIV